MADRSALRDFLKAGVAERRGETQIAANLTRQAMDSVDWDTKHCVYSNDECGFYLDDAFDWMTAYVTTDMGEDFEPPNRVLLDASTWDTLNCEPEARLRFVTDMQAGGPGMKFMSVDDDVYARAVRREAYLRGTDQERTRDQLETLAEEIRSLATAAANINGNFDDVQQQTFAVHYARLRNRHEALENRMAEIQGLLEVAASAMWSRPTV